MDTERQQEQLIEALAVTAEVCGTDISKGAAKVMAADLARYPHPQVMASLARCRREVKGRLSLADIITRIDDGRPTADQAWGMYSTDERQTLCCTEETFKAMEGIEQLAVNDERGARFAFKEAYNRIVQENRNNGAPVRWRLSLGWQEAGRAAVVQEAIALGRITPNEAIGYVPQNTPLPPAVRKALGTVKTS